MRSREREVGGSQIVTLIPRQIRYESVRARNPPLRTNERLTDYWGELI